MKIIQKISIITIITIVSVLLLLNNFHTIYNPIRIDIEFQTNQVNSDIIQFYYTEGRYFDETLSIKEQYSAGQSIIHITKVLPPLNIHKLRIDPGSSIDTIVINEIIIGNNKQIKRFAGAQILTQFDLVNLNILKSSDKAIHMVQNQSPDIQLIYRGEIADEFNLISHRRISQFQIFIFLIFCMLIFTMILFGNGIKKLSDQLKHYLNSKYHMLLYIKFSKYDIILLIILIIKLLFVSAQQMTAYSAFGHDDGLFIKLAYSLSAGNWLGIYNSLTLAKGMIYPAYIAINNFLGIPLFFAQHLLFGLSSYLMLRAFYPFIKGKLWRIFLFTFLLFNPITSDFYTTRVLRDYFFLSISIIVVASFVAVYLRRYQNPRGYLGWILLGSIAMFLQQNTREEGFMFLPFLIFLTVLNIWAYLKRKNAFTETQGQKRTKDIWRGIFIIMLPYIVLVIGNLTIATTNYFAYGVFIRNEVKSSAFTKAFAALTKIKSDDWFIDVPYTTEARMKAYQQSQTFAKIKPFMESDENGFLREHPSGGKEVIGAFSIWAIRYAAEKAGYHDTLQQSQQFYNQIAKELNSAFDSGHLEKNTNFSMFSFTWDARYRVPMQIKIKEIIKFILNFEGYQPYPLANYGELESVSLFQNMTNTSTAHLTSNTNNYTPASIVKIYLLKLIQQFYGIFHPLIWYVSLITFVIVSIKILMNRFNDALVEIWWLGSMFLAISVSRILLIAYISVSQWDAVNMQYLSISYPFLLTFEILYLYTLVKIIKISFNSSLDKKTYD